MQQDLTIMNVLKTLEQEESDVINKETAYFYRPKNCE